MSQFSKSFATESFEFNGKTLKAGDVITDKKLPGYGTSTILGFCEEGPGEWYAKLARPYCYASCVGSTGPSPMLGVECYEVKAEHLLTLADKYEKTYDKMTT